MSAAPILTCRPGVGAVLLDKVREFLFQIFDALREMLLGRFIVHIDVPYLH